MGSGGVHRGGSGGSVISTEEKESLKSDGYRMIDDLESDTYHYFKDTNGGHDDGYSYDYDGYDGAHQIEYMKEHTNVEDLMSQMSSSEKNDFVTWGTGHFMSGQQYVKKFSDMSLYDQGLTRTYDKYLDKATLDKGIISARLASAELLGLSSRASKSEIESTLKRLSGNDGEIVWSLGDMSTGLARTGLGIGYSSSKPIEYKFHIPKGSTGAGMWIGGTHSGDRTLTHWAAEQREFMINRDTAFKVGGYKYDSKRGKYIVEMYYVGRREHDYS